MQWYHCLTPFFKLVTMKKLVLLLAFVPFELMAISYARQVSEKGY